jgi:hypothetical protein
VSTGRVIKPALTRRACLASIGGLLCAIEGHAMPAASDVSLHAQCQTSGGALRIGYRLHNRGRHDIYVLNAFEGVHPNTRQPYVDTSGNAVFLQAPDTGVVLLGIAPLPPFMVYVRVMPVATKLPAGAERSWQLPPLKLPLTEFSVYDGGRSQRLRESRIHKLILRVEYLSAAAEGFSAQPLAHDANWFDVDSKNFYQDVHPLEATLLERDMPMRVFADNRP